MIKASFFDKRISQSWNWGKNQVIKRGFLRVMAAQVCECKRVLSR